MSIPLLDEPRLKNLITDEELPHRDLSDWNAPAALSAMEFLKERYQKERCDHPAVSCCVRCNVMYLIDCMERAHRDRAPIEEARRER